MLAGYMLSTAAAEGSFAGLTADAAPLTEAEDGDGQTAQLHRIDTQLTALAAPMGDVAMQGMVRGITVSGNDGEAVAAQVQPEDGQTTQTQPEDGQTTQTQPTEGQAAQTEVQEAAQTPEPQESEYADLAIAQVDHYVNVRTEPNTDSQIVGKIYNGAVAQILDTAGEAGDWFKVTSGNVEGYIKAEFFLWGDAAEAVIDQYVTRYAEVLPQRLNVRKEPGLDAGRIGYVDCGEKVRVLEDLGEWLKIAYTDSRDGYVSAEYVTVTEEFTYAKTLEEEAAELAAKKALEERQKTSETAAAENTTINVAFPATDYESVSELRSSIIDYAMQYLGNRYVHGGNSLSTGTDCSGFTSLIYAQFGYSISRTPSGQLSGDGRSIAYEEIQPGDIICYGSSGKCTHVALYIGDGQIIHSANSRKGVITNNADYDTILGIKNVID